MSNFTPGPWTAELEEDSPHWTVRAPYPGKGNATFELCRMSGTTAQNEIDATAISLVPEMVELLWNAWQDLNALSQGEWTVEACNEAKKTMEKTMALLRRIDGEGGSNG